MTPVVLALLACSEGFGLNEVTRPRDAPHDTGPVDSGDTGDTGSEGDSGDSAGPDDSTGEDSVPVDTGDSGEPAPDLGIWTLAEGARTWVGHASGDGAHAPSATIESAFALGEVGRVVVLTRNTWHVLLLDDLSWIDSGDRDTLFPEVAGQQVKVAATVPAFWGDGELASIWIVTGATAWLYTFALDTRTYAFDIEATVDWSADPDAPDPDSVALAWVAVDEDAGWASAGSPAEECGVNATTLGPYIAYITTDGLAHLFDAGWCNSFAATMDADSLSVFTYADAPDPDELAAIDWTGEQLIAFAP